MTPETDARQTMDLRLRRDRHLFGPGPKRILALDGGGVRGIVSVAFLQRIEQILLQQQAAGDCLGDWFDLIGGTSTGAIIATTLVLGRSAGELEQIYRKLAPLVFKQPRWRIGLLKAIYDAEKLRHQIEAFTADRTLSSDDLITGLCIVAKRLDTGSPWILSNDPLAPYWHERPGASFIANKHYRLSTLVRASTAAPRFFDPEIIPIIESGPPAPETQSPSFADAVLKYLRLRRRAALDPEAHGLFVDGGVTPHGNPALALFHMSQFERFGLRWPTGPANLTVVSIGTGTYRPRVPIRRQGLTRLASMFAVRSLESLMTDCERLVLAQMQWMGECPAPWEINSEVGTLAADGPSAGKLFRFLRYDVVLEREWLADHLGMTMTQSQVDRLRRMDDAAMIDDIYGIAKVAAERQVKPEHWLPPAA